MRRPQIVFERTKGFIGWLIRKITRSEINHVAIVFDSGDWHTKLVIEADLKVGVVLQPARKRRWNFVFDMAYTNATSHVAKVERHIGQEYDLAGTVLLGALTITFGFLKKVFGKAFKVDFKKIPLGSKGQFCSELVARVIQLEVGTKYMQRPQWMSPQDLLVLCRSREDLFKVNDSSSMDDKA